MHRAIPLNFQVFEREPKRYDTGLLDSQGRNIVRWDDPEPMGFIHFARKDPNRVEEDPEVSS
jgi:hypothetical protein